MASLGDIKELLEYAKERLICINYVAYNVSC